MYIKTIPRGRWEGERRRVGVIEGRDEREGRGRERRRGRGRDEGFSCT